MVKNILFTFLFVVAIVGCNNDDIDEPPATEQLLYLDKNGVTVKCQDWGVPGQSGELNEIVYTIVDKDMLKQMIRAKEDVTTVCTSKITNMRYMIANSPLNQDISSWDVSNVTDMSNMFFQAGSFNQDISPWDVSNVTTMYSMFWSSPFNQNISSWDVSNVTNCSGFSDNAQWTLPKPNFTNCNSN